MSKQFGRMQTTLAGSVALSGIGVHSGAAVTATLHPADPNSGISFVRTDCAGGGRLVRADWRHVSGTDHSTTLASGDCTVATVEHLMAALSALEIDNALVEVTGPEMPILDGSAAPFVEAIDSVGVRSYAAPRRFIKVLKPVRAECGRSFGELLPGEGRQVEIEIDFAHCTVGRQRFSAPISADLFRRDISRARTFGFLADVEMLWAHGLALGASLDNAIVLGADRVINPEGLRFADEFVRHKTLDAIGDLSLAGAPVIGRFRSYRGGHALNKRVLEALFADATAWTYVEMPVRRPQTVGRQPVALEAAAYGPDVS
ncbi:MAG: UDP-3-O-acyl-N-acetylglucosamine deacetylase [Bauldia sp.]